MLVDIFDETQSDWYGNHGEIIGIIYFCVHCLMLVTDSLTCEYQVFKQSGLGLDVFLY